MATTTKHALATALRELMQKTTLDNITVKDIVEQAGVSRQTFYYHFGDVYQLLDWAFRDIVKELCSVPVESWKERLLYAMNALRDNRALVMNVYHSLGVETMGVGLERVIRPIVEESGKKRLEKFSLSEEEKNFVISFFVYGVMGTIIEWVGDGMPEDLDRMIKKIHQMIHVDDLHLHVEFGKKNDPA